MAEEASVTDEAREMGTEEVEAAECPNCGATLESHEEADGGVSYGPCPSCYSADADDEEPAAKEKASASVARERGTNVKEN
jgi:hypothetical protein